MMRISCVVSVFLMLELGGCAANTSGSEETTPAPSDSRANEVVESDETTSDDRQRVLEAATDFGAILGSILVTVPDARSFEACERAGELVEGAAALRDAGVPDGVADPDVYREELARLPAATTMMATYCGRGVDTVPSDFWVSAELTFYRILLQLEPLRGGASTERPGDSSHIVVARSVREVLAPVVEAHREDRVGALCQRADELVASVERLQGEGTPSGLPSSQSYAEETTSLLSLSRSAATECGEGADSVSGSLTISIEVTFDRLWLMLHGRWPGASAAQ